VHSPKADFAISGWQLEWRAKLFFEEILFDIFKKVLKSLQGFKYLCLSIAKLLFETEGALLL
jgi:hypothetical protein